MNRSARDAAIFIVGMSVVAVLAGCRTWPTNTKPAPSPLASSYVGVGNLDGGLTNVILLITGPDSAGNFAGGMYYRDTSSTFTSVTVNAASDSVRFRFLRSGTVFDGTALVLSSALMVEFSLPTGIQSFRVNRELEGYNLTGLWNGSMYSALTEFTRNATMTMDQNGQLFNGEIDVTFDQAYHFMITTGTANQNAMQMSGTARISALEFPTLFVGTYSEIDTVQGTWQAGQNSEIDHGDFIFVRSFN
jgi:hypothetical protein